MEAGFSQYRWSKMLTRTRDSQALVMRGTYLVDLGTGIGILTVVC
jgi:hypothetical protein